MTLRDHVSLPDITAGFIIELLIRNFGFYEIFDFRTWATEKALLALMIL